MARQQRFHQLLELRSCVRMLAGAEWRESPPARLKGHRLCVDRPKQQPFRQIATQQKRLMCFERKQRCATEPGQGCCPHQILSAHRVAGPTAKQNMRNMKGHGMACYDRKEKCSMSAQQSSGILSLRRHGCRKTFLRKLHSSTRHRPRQAQTPHHVSLPFYSRILVQDLLMPTEHSNSLGSKNGLSCSNSKFKQPLVAVAAGTPSRKQPLLRKLKNLNQHCTQFLDSRTITGSSVFSFFPCPFACSVG